ncbi:hypothetical protein DBR32_08590 [Taibaiella sp. KBW10]|nr:hypothetical protein DBR32_08590 [Taibaiella sp. KBW10]
MMISTASVWAQKNSTRTTTYKGNKLEWEMVNDKVTSVSQYTGKDTIVKVLNRGHLLSLNGVKVGNDVATKTRKSIEKYLKKNIAKEKMKVPKFNNNDLRIHLSNCVLNETGKIVYFELFFFPKKDDLQLYPNEYTPEVKAYLSKVEQMVDNAPLFNNEQQQPLYFAEPIVIE